MADTRVYRYGLLRPTGGHLVVEEQMRRAHRYHNELIATAQALWETEQEIQRAHSTALAAAEAARQPAEEGAGTAGQPLRAQRVQLAPSMLRQALVQAFRARGGVVLEMPAAGTTIRCAACGDVDDTWDRAAHLVHTCRTCGQRWDQDANACRNLLRLAREWRSDDGSAGTARSNDSAAMGGHESVPRGRFQRRKLAARKRGGTTHDLARIPCQPAP